MAIQIQVVVDVQIRQSEMGDLVDTEAIATINDEDSEPRLELVMGEVTVLIEVQDVLDALKKLEIDISEWIK